MPRWDDPSIIGQPDQTPEPPPPTWSGWRPEPSTVVFHSPRVTTREELAASARRHPAFQGLDLEQQGRAISALFGEHKVSDLRHRIPHSFGR